ncbi:MAG: hypothetical protein H0U71_03935 [Gammaproteobacteria bacterium]|nr:hypothetical protein [Gammaproteobacteria bacterium]
MKFIKALAPVLLSGLLAFPAFAAENQNAPMAADQNAQMQGQQQVNAANENQQLAASNEKAQSDMNGEKTKTIYHKNQKCKCKCKTAHKKANNKQAKNDAMNADQAQQASADNNAMAPQAQEAQSPASNQNS